MIIDRLWRGQPGKFFCISTKSARGKWEDHFFARNELNQVADFVRDHSDKDVYFCPHGFTKPRRLKPYAAIPSLLWSDMDEADPREVKIKPTIAIESSPGRYVGIWVLDEEMTESANRRLAYLLGCDKSGWDLTQVLRVPGTRNYKYNSHPRVRILWSDGPRYTLKEIEKQLPDEDDVPGDANNETDAAAVYKKWEKKLPHRVRRELISGRPQPGKRSEMIWKLTNELIEAGVPREDAFVLLKASPWNKFAGRRNEDEQLERELDKAVNKHFVAKKRVAAEDDDEEDDGYKWLEVSLDEVEEENIDWIWYPYLARGELTILEGDPDRGKSYLAQMVSGHIIDGKRLPSVKKHGEPVQGRVVYFDIENSAGSVTKKRIAGNGFKNLNNYIQEEALFSIDDDPTLDRIFDALERVKPVLVVFDTLNTYLGKADAFKGHEAQQAFARFREIARRFNCAVLVLRHLTKSNKERALYRGQGSIAFAGLARVVMTVGVLPEDEETKAMAVTKLNIGKKPPALTFTIRSLPDTIRDTDRSAFEFGEFVEVSADDILSSGNDKVSERGAERKAAEEFLKEALEEGEVEVTRIEKMAEKRSIAGRTLRRASEEMGIVKRTRGFGREKRSFWSLPDDEAPRASSRRGNVRR